jgi:hypothetical protein
MIHAFSYCSQSGKPVWNLATKSTTLKNDFKDVEGIRIEVDYGH